jgi:glycosyltransferase involved in cell wall biosynthesis
VSDEEKTSGPRPLPGRESRAKERWCVIVPAYNEAKRVGDVVSRILEYASDVVVVDDGSTDETVEKARKAGATVLRHERNQGKGMALNTGFKHAREQGFDIVLTMDADGQHNPADIPRFVEAYVRTGIPVLIGNRMSNCDNMPFIRRMTNRFMSYLLSEEMGQYVPDTQCGFRLYKCEIIPLVLAESGGYAAESELLLHVADRALCIDSVAIQTVYADEKSKINPVRDTVRFFSMLRRYRRAGDMK